MNFRHVLLTVFVLCGAFSAAAQTLVIYDARDLFPKDAWNPPCKAVVYNLQCIGEGAYMLSKDFVAAHNDITFWSMITTR